MTDKLPRMTPLYHVRQAEQHFAAGKGMYRFNVPDDRVTESYIARIRRHAKLRRYHWRVAHVDGQEWIIKEKSGILNAERQMKDENKYKTPNTKNSRRRNS